MFKFTDKLRTIVFKTPKLLLEFTVFDRVFTFKVITFGMSEGMVVL